MVTPVPARTGASASTLVSSYLEHLAAHARPATLRQRRWALNDLLAHTQGAGGPDVRAEDLLQAPNLRLWLAAAANPTNGRPASTAGQRARAGAARALAAFAATHHLADPDPAAGPALRLPRTGPASVDHRNARNLLTWTMDAPPPGVPYAIWVRFTAHTHLLASTGAPERELAHLHLEDIAAHATAVRTGEGWTPLGDPARHVLSRWLEQRHALVAALQGSDPGAVWLRVHPGVNRRTGVIAPAGLPITARGLRRSFTTTLEALAEEDATVRHLSVRDVRALGRLDPFTH